MIKLIFSGLFIMLIGMAAYADDVQFTLLEKNVSYEVDKSGTLHSIKNEFVSETILSKGGAIIEGALKRAGSDESIFKLKASESFFNRYANTYPDFASLDKTHPNTEYVINIVGKTSSISGLTLSFDGPDGKAELPDPIRIKLLQDNKEVSSQQVEHEKDLQVMWSKFSKGAADPRGIMDDLIFALISDCHGNSVSRSGIPFIMPDYLTFQADKYAVQADKLQPGLAYEVKVIHVNAVDTKQVGDTTAMATYNTSTKMNFQTTGETIGPACAAGAAESK